MGGIILTHPYFPKLPTAKFLHKLQRLPWDLPFILCPGSLGNQGYAGSCEALAQAIPFLCVRTKHRIFQWNGRAKLHLHMPGRSQPMGNLHKHTNVSATAIKGCRMDPAKRESSKGAIEEQVLQTLLSKHPSCTSLLHIPSAFISFLMEDTLWL